MPDRKTNKWALITRSGLAVGALLFIAGIIVRDTTFDGLVDASQLGFYLQLIGGALALGCTAANYRSIINFFTRSKPAERANTLIACALAIILTGLVCYISTRRYARLDWTGHRFYTLHSRTRRMLRHLNTQVNITIIYQEPDQQALKSAPHARLIHWGYKQSRQMLDEFNARCPNITLKTLDLSEAAEVNRLGEKYDLPSRCVLFETEQSHEIIPFKQVVRASKKQGGQLLFNGEAAFTSALLKLTTGQRQKVYFLTGHGERVLGPSQKNRKTAEPGATDILLSREYSLSNFVSRLEADNYTVTTLNLTKTPEVPDDCDVLIIAGPRSPIPTEQITAIRSYLQQDNGRAIVMADSHLRNPDHGSFSLNKLLRDYGVVARTKALGMVRSKQLALTSAGIQKHRATLPRLPVTKDGFAQHPITTDLQNYTLMFVQSAPLLITDSEPRPELRTNRLLTSVEQSWGETDPDGDLKTARFHPGTDIPGPIISGLICRPAALSGSTDKESSSGSGPDSMLGLVVFGSSLSFVNKVTEQRTANLYLLLNAVNWLAGREQMVGIPAKSMALNTVHFTNEQVRLARWIFLLGLPACIIIPGICVWCLRK